MAALSTILNSVNGLHREQPLLVQSLLDLAARHGGDWQTTEAIFTSMSDIEDGIHEWASDNMDLLQSTPNTELPRALIEPGMKAYRAAAESPLGSAPDVALQIRNIVVRYLDQRSWTVKDVLDVVRQFQEGGRKLSHIRNHAAANVGSGTSEDGSSTLAISCDQDSHLPNAKAGTNGTEDVFEHPRLSDASSARSINNVKVSHHIQHLELFSDPALKTANQTKDRGKMPPVIMLRVGRNAMSQRRVRGPPVIETHAIPHGKCGCGRKEHGLPVQTPSPPEPTPRRVSSHVLTLKIRFPRPPDSAYTTPTVPRIDDTTATPPTPSPIPPAASAGFTDPVTPVPRRTLRQRRATTTAQLEPSSPASTQSTTSKIRTCSQCHHTHSVTLFTRRSRLFKICNACSLHNSKKQLPPGATTPPQLPSSRTTYRKQVLNDEETKWLVDNADRYGSYPDLARAFNGLFEGLSGKVARHAGRGDADGQERRTGKSEHQLGQAVWRLRRRGVLGKSNGVGKVVGQGSKTKKRKRVVVESEEEDDWDADDEDYEE